VPGSSKAALAVAAIVAVGLVLRLTLLPINGYRDDIAVFETWSRVLAEGGPMAIYGTGVVPRVDYPPGYLYILWLVGLVRRALDPHLLHPNLFRAILKIPNVIADFEAAALGYAIVRRYAPRWHAVGVLAALLIGPVFWLDSAFWGQADTIAAALIFAAILLRLRDRSSLAWFVLALAVLVKPQGVVLVPIFAVRSVMRGYSAASLLRTVLSVGLLTYLATLPFTTERSPVAVLRFLADRYIVGVSKVAHGSEGAFTLYTIVGGFFRSDAQRFAGVPLHAWSIVLVVAALVTITWWLARTMRATTDPRELDRAFVYAAALCLGALFFLGTRMHERYLLPGLACATLVAFEALPTGAAVVALTLSFAVNCALIIAGFSGGGHHPQAVWIGHIFSAVNLVAFAVVALSSTRGAQSKWWRQGDSNS